MNTTYFDEMTFNCAAYERAKMEREERKAQIAKVHGYNSRRWTHGTPRIRRQDLTPTAPAR